MITDKENKPDKENKQLQAMLYAIQRSPFINRTQLMKYIFFVDLFYYNKTKKTLLEDSYVRFPRGPVPLYGFDYTKMQYGEDYRETETFSIIKEKNREDPKIYHYRFKLKPGVFANMDLFREGEKDLLKLTLRAVSSRNATEISEITHTYSLWKKHVDGEKIDLERFKLSPQEEDQLELFLNAKVYLTPIRETIPRGERYETDKEPTLIQGYPERRLPVYFNEQTKTVE